MKWTPKEDNRLRTYYRVLSWEDIGRLLGRTGFACRSRAKRLGLIEDEHRACGGTRPKTILNDMQWLMVKCLHDCGFSIKEIHDHFSGGMGQSYESMKHRLYAYPDPPQPKRYVA